MKKTLLIAAMLIGAYTGTASAASIAITSALQASMAMSTLGDCSFYSDCRVIADAKDDALVFLANNQIRGVKLQQALEIIRFKNPSLKMSDVELAAIIIENVQMTEGR